VIDWIQRWTRDAKTPAADDKKGTAGTKG